MDWIGDVLPSYDVAGSERKEGGRLPHIS